MGLSIVITGTTGFLGKVVLEELLRCRDGLDIVKIWLLIRPVGLRSAQERFCDEIAASLCFSRLKKSRKDQVQVVEWDLSRPGCAIQSVAYTQMCEEVTHIIHCAGSVAFSSATKELVSDNIISALNILELARECKSLQRVVSTSTAFVSPPTESPIDEYLLRLPMPAQDLYELLLDEKTDPREILEITGHPNLYTLSKALAEHLLIEKRGHVPLVILRPSIISASACYPFPGWIDSLAALAGLVASTGTGVLRVLKADPEAVMDVVPVDDVARRLIEETIILGQDTDDIRIVHVVSTIKDGIKIAAARSIALDYFRRQRLLFKPRMRFVKSRSQFPFLFYDVLEHRLPQAVANLIATIFGDTKELRRIKHARKVQVHANDKFKIFTHNTYDFRCRYRSLSQDFRSDKYMIQICQGVQEYLLQRNHL